MEKTVDKNPFDVQASTKFANGLSKPDKRIIYVNMSKKYTVIKPLLLGL